MCIHCVCPAGMVNEIIRIWPFQRIPTDGTNSRNYTDQIKERRSEATSINIQFAIFNFQLSAGGSGLGVWLQIITNLHKRFGCGDQQGIVDSLPVQIIV